MTWQVPVGLRIIMRATIGCVLVLLFSLQAHAHAQDSSWRIEILWGARQLKLLKDGAVVGSYPIATGPRLQRLRHAKIINKAENPPWRDYDGTFYAGGSRDNPLGSRWMGLSIRGPRGRWRGIHGTNDERIIGTRRTHGCFRMRNRDIEFLYRLVPIGTEVVIYE